MFAQKRPQGSRSHGADELWVRGVAYRHTAAKFWSQLMDELQTQFPQAREAELEISTDLRLSPRMLRPAHAASVDLDEQMQSGEPPSLAEVIAEMDVYGPPSPVSICLRAATDEEISRGNLPLEYVDAEIFPYLVVWLLNWAGIAGELWNNEFLQGEFHATDRQRGRRYAFRCDFQRAHVTEGMYRQIVVLDLDGG